jgi:hypothetical protein
MELVTPIETICRLILRAREMEAQDADVDTDDEVDAADSEDEFAILDDESNEAVEEEIFALLDELGDEQVEEILALAWVGRGTYDASEWSDALERARSGRANRPDHRDAHAGRLSGRWPRGVRPELRRSQRRRLTFSRRTCVGTGAPTARHDNNRCRCRRS